MRHTPELATFTLADHAYWVDQALIPGQLLDFLSPTAARDIVRKVAARLHADLGTEYPRAGVRAVLDAHALAGVLSEQWRSAVALAVDDTYVALEQGRWPHAARPHAAV